jgi:hypothetical protein
MLSECDTDDLTARESVFFRESRSLKRPKEVAVGVSAAEGWMGERCGAASKPQMACATSQT